MDQGRIPTGKHSTIILTCILFILLEIIIQKKEKYLSAIDNIAGLQVNFTSPRYTDGGEYGCRVWTSHPQHVVVAYAELYVFYPGISNNVYYGREREMSVFYLMQ